MKHKKDKDHKLRADVRRTQRRRRPRWPRCSRRAAPLLQGQNTPWCRRASARARRRRRGRRTRSCSAGCVRLAPGGGAARRRYRTEPLRATWGPGWGRQTNGTARVPRQQRAQQREKGRGGSVLCGCPPGNLDPCGVQRDSTQQSRRTRVFPQHGSARGVAGSRGRTGCGGFVDASHENQLDHSSSSQLAKAETPLVHSSLHQSLQYVAAWNERCRRGRGEGRCRVHRCAC